MKQWDNKIMHELLDDTIIEAINTILCKKKKTRCELHFWISQQRIA